jgi:hypothetical protein
MSKTREVVEAYFHAWTTKRIDDAYDRLADDLHFAGPNGAFESAEDFRPALVGFCAMSRGARLVELVVEGDRAAMLYDCDLPEPVGTVRISSFFRVEGDRIAWYETWFDASELRKLLAARRAGVE